MTYTDKEKAETRKKYFRSTNMSFSELRRWAENDLSCKASLDRSPIKRNLELLSTPVSQWNTKHYRWANKSIGYLARAKKIPRAKEEIGNGYTRNEIAMKNWAYDIKKR